MKKVFLLSLGLFLGFGAYAQQNVIKADYNVTRLPMSSLSVGNDVVESEALDYAPRTKESVVVNRFKDCIEGEVITTTFDMQSNGFIANRMYQKADGSVAVVANFSASTNASATDRGTGYNFFDGESWLDVPTVREEANATGEDIRTGWPSIAPYGENGEILVCHTGTTGLIYYTRETAGEGVWNGPNEIPNPVDLEGQPCEFDLSWPRVVTSGENNDIIHVFAAGQTTVTEGEKEYNYVGQFYCRYAEGEWSVNWSPIFEGEEHMNCFGGDDYAAAANGDVVAVIYAGNIDQHVVLCKSEDNGLTWEREIVWNNPYRDEFKNATGEDLVLTEQMFMPNHASLAVGYDGTVHVAMSTYLVQATNEIDGEAVEYGMYVWSGLSVDGVVYWNDTYGVPFNENDPLQAMKLWWEYDAEEYPDMEGYIYNCYDTINFCGFMPVEFIAAYDNSKYYKGNDYSSMFGGLSAYPAIAVDPAGNLAVAYTSLDANRVEQGTGVYLRSCFISYKRVGDEGWFVNADNAVEVDDFLHSLDEVISISAVPASANENEFWFSYSSDMTPGMFQGTYAQQSTATDNTIYVIGITPADNLSIEESQSVDAVYNIFPNPASGQIFVSSKMDTNATITFTNIAGQTVKVVNQDLATGNNGVSINDLNTGIYFCTITANGFSHTTKVVVK